MNRLRELRLASNKQQKEIAKFLNVSVSAYSNYELGLREPSYDILTKLAKYFDVSIDYLLCNTDDPSNLVPVPELPNVYYRLAKEAMDRGIPPEDAEKIIDIYTKFINKNVDDI